MYPHFKDKHKEPSLITPKQRLEYFKAQGRYPSFQPPKVIIFCYQSSFLRRVLEKYPHQQCDGCFHKLYFLIDEPGVAIGDFGIGAPSIAAKLELFIAWGVRNFISMGLAGSLQYGLEIGDIVVCEKAIRDEGTSHHYKPFSKYAEPSSEITKKIICALNEMNIPSKCGTSWTVDTLYRQTAEEVKHWQEEGVLTVEMEAAALFTIAEYYKVELGAVFTISDTLASLAWDPHFEHSETSKGLDTLLECVLEVAKKVKN